MNQSTAGIDVGKRELDVSVDEDRARRFANTAAGVAELVGWLGSQGPLLAVCEATGGYEALVVQALRQVGVPVHIAHPNQVRAFARACGYQAKTDGLDAMVLSRYGQVFQPAPTLAQEADRGQLQDLRRRREQLVGQRTQEKNRLSRVHNPAAQDSVRRHIAWLDQEIGMLDDQYRELHQELLEQNVEFRRQVEAYRSVPGVGVQTAAALVAWLPELGRCDGKALAARCGVAPWSRDSGQKRGYRSTRGGRRPVRRVLYLACMASIRSTQGLGDFYRQLRQRGIAGQSGAGGSHAEVVAATERRSPPRYPLDRPIPTHHLILS